MFYDGSYVYNYIPKSIKTTTISLSAILWHLLFLLMVSGRINKTNFRISTEVIGLLLLSCLSIKDYQWLLESIEYIIWLCLASPCIAYMNSNPGAKILDRVLFLLTRLFHSFIRTLNPSSHSNQNLRTWKEVVKRVI